MTNLMERPAFRDDYAALRQVSLNPARHAANNAHEHCEMVHSRTLQLAFLNDCSDAETELPSDLARCHDIGKITGSARPADSVLLLEKYGVSHPRLIALVKYHDTNLPWFLAFQRGEAPTDKAWNRLTRKVDLRLLCLFMVADRVDCPGGWKQNEALTWFLGEVECRKLLDSPLKLDEGPVMSMPVEDVVERSAGAVLVDLAGEMPQTLVIRVRERGYEIPKGHIEPGESAEQAAARELCEETGLIHEPRIADRLGTLEYTFQLGEKSVRKCVDYFTAYSAGENGPAFRTRPNRTRELRWVTQEELASLPLVNDDLRSLIALAFQVH